MTQQQIREISWNIVKAAIEVHQHLGPGLLESIYEDCLVQEIKMQFGYEVATQQQVPVHYKGVKVRRSLRLDVLVEDTIIVEVKSTDGNHAVHQAQLLTYMSLAEKPKGILINFNTKYVAKSSIHLVNGFFANLPVK